MTPTPAPDRLDRPDRGGRLLRYLPLAVTAALTLACILGVRGFTVEELLNYTPASLPLAAAVFLCAYAVKSLSVVFPLSLLYIAAGVVFPLWMAWGVNLAGLLLCVTLPYWVGRISGSEMANKIIRTYPKAARVNRVVTRNQVLTAYLLRVLGFLPGDLVSILMGSMGMEYRGYLAGSLLGLLPGMLIQTALGVCADRPTSPVFWLLCLLMLLISAVSAAVCARHAKKEKTEG